MLTFLSTGIERTDIGKVDGQTGLESGSVYVLGCCVVCDSHVMCIEVEGRIIVRTVREHP